MSVCLLCGPANYFCSVDQAKTRTKVIEAAARKKKMAKEG